MYETVGLSENGNMITIPKHTIPTYNPSSTAINEQSDFTRRIPSYPPKIRVRVEKVIKQLIQAYESKIGRASCRERV